MKSTSSRPLVCFNRFSLLQSWVHTLNPLKVVTTATNLIDFPFQSWNVIDLSSSFDARSVGSKKIFFIKLHFISTSC